MSYRIKKTTDLDGLFVYIPQYKKFFIYWDFWETSFPPHKIFFRSYELAEKFIKTQIEKPKDEYYTINK